MIDGYAVSLQQNVFEIWRILHKKWWRTTMKKQTRCYYYTQLIYQQETLSQSFAYTPLILMYFFLLFRSIQYFVQIQYPWLVAATGKTLCEICPNTEFFLVRIQSDCGKIRTRKNSVFGHFSRSENIHIYSSNIQTYSDIFHYI